MVISEEDQDEWDALRATFNQDDDGIDSFEVAPQPSASTSRFRPAGEATPHASTARKPLPDLPFVNEDELQARGGGGGSRRAQTNGGSNGKGKGREVDTLVIDDDEEEMEEEMEDVMIGAEDEWEQPPSDALQALDAELSSLDSQIAELQQLRTTLLSDRAALLSRQRAKSRPRPAVPTKKAGGGTTVDYFKAFEWSDEARKLAKETWGIEKFRLCQEGAINAAVDGRDLCVIMPTGGGKSLIYQLPALMQSGTTLVITPLISLMQDQTYNLTKLGIRAEMLHAATTKEESKAITARLVRGGTASKTNGKGKGKIKAVKSVGVWGEEDEDGDEREVKLCYVTPERVDKSKTFISTLQKMYDSSLLTRIVIDEAHCTSTSGHDYRPSYLTLGKLKSLFPTVPISALTATAPSVVVQDMLKILHMPRVTSPGDAAIPKTSVLFTAPLYRPNLRYSVVPKPKEAAQVIGAMSDYILEKHPGETGIIYCLSRADTENVAKGLNDESEGKIKAGVYHAYLEDADKLRIHKLWRTKKLHIVCATNAFGLGIDAPDVRYVLHHTLSKSLEGYYQESGRAGRDGEESDCVIFYRSADASRLSTLILGDFFAGGKEMLSYAENLSECRKLTFANYFTTTHASTAAFQLGAASEKPCGHCDNCLRDSSSFEAVDISLQAYRTLRIIAAADARNGTLTVPQASDLVRGLGGGSFGVSQGKNKGKEKMDVAKIAGGKVTLSKEETESMLIQLLLKGYLEEEFYQTAYSTLSYLRTSRQQAIRLTRLAPDQVEEDGSNLPVSIKMEMRGGAKGKGKKRKAASAEKGTATKKPKPASTKSKGKKAVVVSDDVDGGVSDDGEDDEFDGPAVGGSDGSDEVEVDEDGWEVFPRRKETEVIELD